MLIYYQNGCLKLFWFIGYSYTVRTSIFSTAYRQHTCRSSSWVLYCKMMQTSELYVFFIGVNGLLHYRYNVTKHFWSVPCVSDLCTFSFLLIPEKTDGVWDFSGKVLKWNISSINGTKLNSIRHIVLNIYKKLLPINIANSSYS